ncbi:MAG: leucyl aminopeptidase [Acinetobacter sp.]|nr:leucyl aminopeptidase [Acinetobacter sp.]
MQTLQFSINSNSNDAPIWLLSTEANQVAQAQTFVAAAEQSFNAHQFTSAFNEQILLVSAQNQAVYVLGLGDTQKLTPSKLPKLAQSIIKASQKKAERIAIDISNLPAELHYVFALSLSQAHYQFDEFKSEQTNVRLAQIDLIAPSSPLTAEQLQFVQALQSGQNYARDLANRPGNVCFPEYLADQALALAAEFPDLLKVTVLDHAQMRELGMNAFLAVAQGSAREGRLITLEYQAQRSEQPVVLVGKGVTFDTGGISLKPAANMDEMKFDMGGAASVFGTIRALCEARLPIHVVGAIAAAENMPSGTATRPGDIVTSMSGQTIEILNTDAEGRLVLCDTLTYVKRFNPALVVDIATLTGACVVALGKIYSGLFSDDAELIQDLTAAGEQTYDRVWSMPVHDDYQELLDSPFADMGNISTGGYGGAITAACFLKRFTKDYRWAHLDIAGSAWVSGTAKGATGRPVPLLLQFLYNRSQA